LATFVWASALLGAGLNEIVNAEASAVRG